MTGSHLLPMHVLEVSALRRRDTEVVSSPAGGGGDMKTRSRSTAHVSETHHVALERDDALHDKLGIRRRPACGRSALHSPRKQAQIYNSLQCDNVTTAVPPRQLDREAVKQDDVARKRVVRVKRGLAGGRPSPPRSFLAYTARARARGHGRTCMLRPRTVLMLTT